MIFVTVGTHEQQFNRLLKKMDQLKEQNYINEEIIIQTGYSTYKLKNCIEKKFLSYDEMHKYAKECRVMITHGGPASIFLAHQYGKIPVVLPRNPKFDEHVDEHQMLFCDRLSKLKKILLINNLDDIMQNIYLASDNSYKISHSNTDKFVEEIKSISEKLVYRKKE